MTYDKILYFLFFLFCVSPAGFAQLASDVPTKVRQHVNERVDRELNRSIVVGIVTDSSEEYITAGTMSDEFPAKPDKDTLFEIGPVTKLFTAAATTNLVQRKQLSWKTPINALLPQEADPPKFEDRFINIHSLATHSAGLPRLPLNLNPADAKNPYADYGQEDMYAALGMAALPYPPSTIYLYSNFGYGLLGHLLEARLDKPYETIIAERITIPMKMTDTVVTLSDEQRVRLATGHNGTESTPNWDYKAMQGAGALKSTASDMLKFLKAQMGMYRNPLAATYGAMHAPILPTGAKDTMVGYGWQITSRDGTVVYWHNGATGGYASFVGFNPSRRVGVVVLTNTCQNVDEIGFYVLAPDVFPLGEFPPLAHVDEQTLQRYVGTYQMAPGVNIAITREGDRLYARITGSPKFRLYAISDTRFGFANESVILNFKTGKKSGPVPKIRIEGTTSSYDAKRVE